MDKTPGWLPRVPTKFYCSRRIIMSQALEKAHEQLYTNARKSIADCYARITGQARNTPAATRAYEQTELMRWQLNFRDEAQRMYTEAFHSDHIAYPGLLWTEEVEPKLKDPVFKYCDVLASINPEGEPESGKDFRIEDPEANPKKFSYGGPIGVTASGTVLKAISALAASKGIESSALATFLSTMGSVGTVVIISGAVWGAYTLYRNGSQVPVNQVAGKGIGPNEMPGQIDFENLMKAQQACNLKVMFQWLDIVYQLAEAAEQKKMKESAEEGI